MNLQREYINNLTDYLINIDLTIDNIDDKLTTLYNYINGNPTNKLYYKAIKQAIDEGLTLDNFIDEANELRAHIINEYF